MNVIRAPNPSFMPSEFDPEMKSPVFRNGGPYNFCVDSDLDPLAARSCSQSRSPRSCTGRDR